MPPPAVKVVIPTDNTDGELLERKEEKASQPRREQRELSDWYLYGVSP